MSGSQTRVDGPGRPGSTTESRIRTVGVAVAIGGLGLGAPFLVLFPLVVLLTLAGVDLSAAVVALLVVAQFALFVVVGVGYLRWRGFDREDILGYMGVRMPSLRDVALILVTWIVMFVAMLIVAVAITTVVPELVGAEETEPAENPAVTGIAENPEYILIGVIGMFLVVGPAEEILFRGVIQNRLRERMSVVPAIVIASVIFAVAHTVALAGQDPVAIAMTIGILFVPSLGLGAIYEYTGNIVVPSLLHGFHNSVVLLVVYAAATMDEGAVVLLAGVIG